MLKNYFTVAIRNLLRNKVYSFINILGLAIGMACCMLIILFIQDEFRYDRYLSNADRIYRVIRETHKRGSNPRFTSDTLGQLAPALQSELPEIQRTTRYYSRWVQVSYADKGFMQYLCLADSDFLDFFGYRLLDGDAKQVLSEPYSVVITEYMAQKLFGDEDPLGKVISVEERGFEFDYKITGVVQAPKRSHLGDRVDFLTTTIPPIPAVRRYWEEWQIDPSLTRYTQTYLLLKEGSNPAELERKLHGFVERHFGPDVQKQMIYHLQPLTRIHLYTQRDYQFEWRRGDIQKIYIYATVGLFILVIACINFMNLATARSTSRAKEVGMRKAVGAYRVQLIHQFLGESLLVAFLAYFIAIGMVELVLPAFTAFVRPRLVNPSAMMAEPLALGASGLALLSLAGVAVVVGLLAGSYPALFLSGFQPVQVLKGNLKRGANVSWLRKGLVVFQFSISLVGIIGSLIVYQQMEYVKNKDLGFDKNQVIALNLLRHAPSWRPRYQTVKQAFLQHPNVIKATAQANLPGILPNRRTNVRPIGEADEERQMYSLSIDEDFLDVFELELLKGRNISRTYSGDGTMELVLNETAARQLGWADPIGKQIEMFGAKGTIVGVVKDFNFASVRSEIGPLILWNRVDGFKYIALKIRADNVAETIGSIKETWKRFLPGLSFEFSFLDEQIDRMYLSEIKLRQVFEIFFALSIFVASLGLFALAAYTSEQRTKEIGVRKVLGASVSNIVYLFSKDFVILVLAANLFAWPIAFHIMDEWLQSFVYQINLSIWPFLLGGMMILLIAVTTVGYQAIKAARANPVDSLRNE